MKVERNIEMHDRLVFQAVRHPELYARKVSVLEQEIGLTTQQILAVASRHPTLGTFSYKDELFIGLTERKAAYDEDTARSINPFESNYKGDEYRASVLGGKPRFPDDAR